MRNKYVENNEIMKNVIFAKLPIANVSDVSRQLSTRHLSFPVVISQGVLACHCKIVKTSPAYVYDMIHDYNLK